MNSSRPRSVLLISTCCPGGIQSMIETLLASQFAKSWKMSVICSHKNGPMFRKLLLALRAYVSCAYRLLRGDVAVIHIHAAERGSFFRKSIFLWMAKAFGVPVVMHMHAAEFKEFFERCPAWAKRYIRCSLDNCARIITLSQSWQEFYASLTQTQVVMIPNCIPESYEKGLSHEHKKATDDVLYLGKFGMRKGIYDLINAVKPLLDRYPRLELFCGGDGEIERVRQEVSRHGMHERVHILGWVGRQERSELLNRCQIYVLPSYAEGLPVAIIEAMEAGLAIIATKVGGIPEMIQHGINGILVTPGDVTELTAALDKLLSDSSYRWQLGQSARKTYIARYSEAQVMPQFEAIYKELCG
jgi:glycosyltransferase involved in cell wall biosynthesis